MMSSESDNASDDPDPGIFKLRRTKRSTSSRRSHKEDKGKSPRSGKHEGRKTKRRKHEHKRKDVNVKHAASGSPRISRESTSSTEQSKDTSIDLSGMWFSVTALTDRTEVTPTSFRRQSRRASGESLSLSRADITKEDVEILHKEAECVRSICKKKCNSVVEDATDLV